jgi:hypothetical protein
MLNHTHNAHHVSAGLVLLLTELGDAVNGSWRNNGRFLPSVALGAHWRGPLRCLISHFRLFASNASRMCAPRSIAVLRVDADPVTVFHHADEKDQPSTLSWQRSNALSASQPGPFGQSPEFRHMIEG